MHQNSHGSGHARGDSFRSQQEHVQGHSHFGHGHHDHGHAHSHPKLRPSVLGWAMIATLALVAGEVVGGFLGRSVALLNDAVHNLSDVPALGISWLAMRWAERPADSEKTYGYHRAGTLAAFTNALILIILSLWLGYEAIKRVSAPVDVIEGWKEGHDVPIWSLGGGHNALSLHARIPDMHMDECERILISIQEKAAKSFQIDHTTVQLERAGLPATSGYVMPERAKK